MIYRALLILLSRFLPKGIMGGVFIALILSVGSFGLKHMELVSLSFLIPVFITTLLTPECITSKQTQNRGWYGSSLGMCNIIRRNLWVPNAMRITGEILYILSSVLPIHIQVPFVVISITLILFETIFTHPVPLLKREFKPRILL